MKLKSADQEKCELSDELNRETVKLQELRSELKNEKVTSLSLKEKLASYCLQIEELSKHMKNLCTVYEVN